MDQRDTRTTSPLRITLTVFLPFALGYFLSYLYRMVNAVISDDLATSLGASAAGLGLLTSAYFLAFALFQLPLGVLLDRYGPRRVEAGLLLVAAVGSVVFALGTRIEHLAAGRALIGLGVSACLMAALKANVMWWPKERLPLINGCFLAIGALGAIVATTPVAALMQVTDWRGLFLGLAAVTLVAAALIFLIVPERPSAGKTETVAAQIRAAGRVYKSPSLWRLSPAFVLTQAVLLAYITLWTAPWFRDIGGLDRAAVAERMQYVTIAMAFGFLTLGTIAERLSRWGIRPLTVAWWCMAAAAAVEAALALGLTGDPLVPWVLFAYLASSSVLCYAILSQAFPPDLVGRVNTALNMMIFVLAFILQAGIGAVIELFPAQADGSFSPLGHRLALGVLASAQMAALVWMRLSTRRIAPAVGSAA